ncbi:MAG TPA: transporter substrate-binding domain-containing protein [Rhizobiales bacterium]|nr:transporter substrate-binding domain-containing protein [Hyphomicrobiales bacterium]
MMRKFEFGLFGVVLLAGLAGAAHAQTDSTAGAKAPVPVFVPVFRHVEPGAPEPDFKAVKRVRFLAVKDFPPMSYLDRNNRLTGFNISIASNLCRALRLGCSFKAVPYSQLVVAMKNNEGDAVLTGLAETAENLKVLDFTRPYFRFTARFAVRVKTPFKTMDVRELAGKRIGVAAGSQHEAFLKAYYRRSKVIAFKSAPESYEALRTGAVDAVFGDSLALMFWINAEPSRKCCRFAGRGFVDPRSFSRPMAIAVRRGNQPLRAILDFGLDRLQVSGRFAAIYRQYFPSSVWRGNQE